MQKGLTPNPQVVVEQLGEIPQWWKFPLEMKESQAHTQQPSSGVLRWEEEFPHIWQ